MTDKTILQASLEEYRREAAELDLSLQEYLLLLILDKLDQIRYS